MKPSIGRIVHVARLGRVWPAIVVGVNGDDTVDVVAFDSLSTNGGSHVHLGVHFSGAERHPNEHTLCAYWPPRAS